MSLMGCLRGETWRQRRALLVMEDLYFTPALDQAAAFALRAAAVIAPTTVEVIDLPVMRETSDDLIDLAQPFPKMSA